MGILQGSYLVVVNDIIHEGGVTLAADIIDFLLASGFWVFPGESKSADRLQIGDVLVIYQAGKRRSGGRAFVASARLASSVFPISDNGALLAGVRNMGLRWFSKAVRLEEAKRFDRPKPIEPLIPKLEFIADKENYGLALRIGLRRIADRDVKTILGA